MKINEDEDKVKIYNEIISHIMTKMTDTDELNHLKKVIKMRKEDIASDLKAILKPGDRVKVNSTKIPEGVVHKVNRTCAVILEEKGMGWDVPLTMIKTGE